MTTRYPEFAGNARVVAVPVFDLRFASARPLQLDFGASIVTPESGDLASMSELVNQLGQIDGRLRQEYPLDPDHVESLLTFDRLCDVPSGLMVWEDVPGGWAALHGGNPLAQVAGECLGILLEAVTLVIDHNARCPYLFTRSGDTDRYSYELLAPPLGPNLEDVGLHAWKGVAVLEDVHLDRLRRVWKILLKDIDGFPDRLARVSSKAFAARCHERATEAVRAGASEDNLEAYQMAYADAFESEFQTAWKQGGLLLHSRLTPAIGTFCHAAAQEDDQRLVSCCTVLEIIYATEKDQLARQIRTRFPRIVPCGQKVRNIEKRIDEIYDARSVIVHGRGYTHSSTVLADAVKFARATILRILENDDLFETFHRGGDLSVRKFFLKKTFG